MNVMVGLALIIFGCIGIIGILWSFEADTSLSNGFKVLLVCCEFYSGIFTFKYKYSDWNKWLLVTSSTLGVFLLIYFLYQTTTAWGDVYWSVFELLQLSIIGLFVGAIFVACKKPIVD